jgi:hypothetical protein
MEQFAPSSHPAAPAGGFFRSSDPFRKSGQSITEAAQVCDLAADQIKQLGTLFLAICGLVDEHADIHKLAAMGDYLCADWPGVYEQQAADLQELLAGLSTPPQVLPDPMGDWLIDHHPDIAKDLIARGPVVARQALIRAMDRRIAAEVGHG